MKTSEAVMAEVWTLVPQLAPHMFMDGAWIWYCGPTLKHDEAAKKAMHDIGFRFTRRGHLMPDKQTKGWWGHSCERPTRRRRHAGSPPATTNQPQPAEVPDAYALLADL